MHVGQHALRRSPKRRPVGRKLRASGYSRRESSSVQANALAPSPLWGEGWGEGQMRPNSASQNLRSNDALCATIGASPTKRLAAPITSSAGGAPSIISLLMPVYASMNAEMRTPAFISEWKRSTTLPSSTRTMATSVARSPMAGGAAGGFEVDDGDGGQGAGSVRAAASGYPQLPSKRFRLAQASSASPMPTFFLPPAPPPGNLRVL
jgi:hypothetical protein